ncbi:molybdate ABC transporter substrate-binding protein [Tomitella fengzijianii]|uniref:Molybdate ABC transporter substrate-binding protein n=1 Tax=Tomitella fengzijianii TaxID=2597660 RepID=A0A516X187_9ACTN|nr:molybdate ABC transporter substrate-binding protein [Tomitella fengzijianii]QDQ96849.1 molybdate ABC transporter substrate-binding protein [Tomitella fengzijianii]
MKAGRSPRTRPALRACGAAAASLAVLVVSACASGTSDTLTVYAAASLKDTFTQIGHVYEEQYPGRNVEFSFGGSNTLEQQIASGADADVFASANEAVMQDAASAGLTDGDPETFTSNVLTIVTPPGNPAGIASFADLARPGVSVVVCAPQVPCGDAAVRVEDGAGVRLSPVSEENSVTDVLGKVLAGQADAGLVYVTDAAAAGNRVDTVDFPEARHAVNHYPIAVLGGAGGQAGAARDFVGIVTGEKGQRILHDAGFR